MLPLDPEFLIFLKFFVVVTCIVFWLRLGMRWLMRNHRIHQGHRHPPEEEE